MNNKLWLGSVVIAAGAVWAQDSNQSVQNPPSRVARLDLIQGQVSFQPPTVGDWTAATLNYPVTIGDHLFAAADSRAELRIGSSAIRLGPGSSMSFLNLDDRQVQIRLDQGALILRVKVLEADDAYEVDTAGAITILRPGEYRIDTDPEHNTTKVTVRDGDAALTSSAGGVPVHPHQTAVVAADGQAQVQTEITQDVFDLFALQQDRTEDSMGTPRFVSRELPGWEDIDRNGSWTQDPTYGPVWRPAGVETGWAPYRDGHWAWVAPWGWTWIDDAPWGFAPFHYGRWAMVGGHWVWAPGTMPPRPVYAPALVVFAGVNGLGASEGVTPGGGTVAWFPLGPREIFVPAYAVTSLYVDRINSATVNINNVSVVNHDYMNQTAGMTVIDRDTFVMSQSVRRKIIKVPPEAITHAAITRTPAATPQLASVLAHAGAPVDAPHPPAAVMQRPVFAQTAPPQARPARPLAPASAPVSGPVTAPATAPASAPETAPILAPPVRTLPPSPVTARPASPPPAAVPVEGPAPAARTSADLAPGERTKAPRPEKKAVEHVEHVREKPQPAVPDHPLTKEEKAELAKQKRAADLKKAEENDR